MKKSDIKLVSIAPKIPNFKNLLDLVKKSAEKYKTEKFIVTLLNDQGDIVVIKSGLNQWETIGCLERAKLAIHEDVRDDS